MKVASVIEGRIPTNDGIILDKHTVRWVISTMTNSISDIDKPFTETDSHANMCVVGKN